MIDYKCNNGSVSKLVISGNINEILADLTLLISTAYGSVKKQNEECAIAFESCLLAMFLDKEFHNKVFSTEIVEAFSSSDQYESGIGGISIDENVLALMKAIKDAKESHAEEAEEEDCT